MELSISHVVGGNHVRCTPFLTLNQKMLIAVRGNSLLVQNPANGAVLAELVGHTSAVVSVVQCHYDSNLLASLSSRSIVLWDLQTFSRIGTFPLEKDAVQIANDWTSNGGVFILFRVPKEDSYFSTFEICEYNLNTRKLAESALFSKDSASPVLFSSSKVPLAACFHRSLLFWNNDRTLVFTLRHKREITCFAHHPSEKTVAVGDSKGKIIVYYDYLENEDRAQSILHWHANSVLSLAYHPLGTFLYSGGPEGVLVTWNVKNASKSFLPRLGASVVGISSSPNYVAVLLSENSFSLFQAGTSELKWRRKGLTFSSTALEKSVLKTNFLTCENLLITSQPNGYLQFFDLLQNNSASLLDVSQINRTIQTNSSSIGCRIVHFAVSSDRSALATVEQYAEGAPNEHFLLKFWTLRTHPFDYVLNTVKDSLKEFTNLKFHHSRRVVAASSSDGTIRIWKDDLTVDYQEAPIWRPVIHFKYKDLKVTDLSFSDDASILVASHPFMLTFWDTESGNLLKTFLFNGLKITVHVVWNNCLLIHSKHQLSLLHLSSLSTLWSVVKKFNCLAIDPATHSEVALVVNDIKDGKHQSHLLLYSLVGLNPIASYSFSVQVVAVRYAYDASHTPFYCILTQSKEVIVLTLSGSELTKAAAVDEPVRVSPFEQIYGTRQSLRLQIQRHQQLIQQQFLQSQKQIKEVEDIYQHPSHLLPSPVVLADSYYQLVLRTVQALSNDAGGEALPASSLPYFGESLLNFK